MRSLPARVGLAERAPRARLATATVATSVAMLQARYYAVSGMVCGRRFFMRSSGMVQMRFSKLMSAHRVVAALAGRVMVCSCHSIRQQGI